MKYQAYLISVFDLFVVWVSVDVESVQKVPVVWVLEELRLGLCVLQPEGAVVLVSPLGENRPFVKRHYRLVVLKIPSPWVAAIRARGITTVVPPETGSFDEKLVFLVHLFLHRLRFSYHHGVIIVSLNIFVRF